MSCFPTRGVLEAMVSKRSKRWRIHGACRECVALRLVVVLTLFVGCGASDDSSEENSDGRATREPAAGALDGSSSANDAASDERRPADRASDAGRSEAAGPANAGQALDAASRDAAPDSAHHEAGLQGSAGALGTPQATWKEHWFEHDRTLSLVAHNEWVALYFDEDVDRQQTRWMLPFLTRVWQYTIEHYGIFTDGTRDGRLYAIYHQGRYSGGHPSTYFDASHDFRNVSDVGPGPYPDGSFAISTHEVAHVVEGAAHGRQGSPAFGLWKDSKWAEFYQYDLYVGLGLREEAERVYQEFSRKSDDFPRANTFWFRDWFYPLWKEHGGAQVMDSYFRLLAQHFRKGALNWGEFVHFMSGAARADLKSQAERAFGWSDAREAELTRARSDYPGVLY